VTHFHISMPGGLPPGNYQVEILLNGTRVESRSFRVQ
jgi:outer membrane usher protein FimD/PapC